jgi:hypothetical protein
MPSSFRAKIQMDGMSPNHRMTLAFNAVGTLTGPRVTGSTFRRHHRARDLEPQLPRRGPPNALGPASRRPRPDPGSADMADLPAAPAGYWCATPRARKPTSWWSAPTPPWSRRSPNSAATTARRPRKSSGECRRPGTQAPRRVAGGDYARPAADRRGVGLVGEEGWRWRNREGWTTRRSHCRKHSTGCAPW